MRKELPWPKYTAHTNSLRLMVWLGVDVQYQSLAGVSGKSCESITGRINRLSTRLSNSLRLGTRQAPLCSRAWLKASQ